MIIEVLLTESEVNKLKDQMCFPMDYYKIQYNIMKQIKDGINANYR